MRVQEILTADREIRYVIVDEGGNLIIPVVRYLKYLHAIGRARNTLRAYAHNLSLYFTYLAQEHLDYACVTLDDMAGFVLWLKNPYRSLKVLPVQPVTQARTNTTINQCITAVAGFYDYLWRRHAHLLRHSSLTSLAKHGWRPELLRERAGHTQISSTYQLYVHPSDEELREAWEQTQERLRLSQPRQEER